MAHYALINENNVVVNVITGVDEDVTQIDADGKEVGGSSEAWEHFYSCLPWFQGLYCKRTSYNANIRKQYAGIGYTYDPTNDVFIKPKPYKNWILDENFDWQPPMPKPQGEGWYWDQENSNWLKGLN